MFSGALNCFSVLNVIFLAQAKTNRWEYPSVLTQVLKIVCSISSFLLHNLFDSLYNLGQQVRMLPIYQGIFSTSSEVSLTREIQMFASFPFGVCRPRGVNDAGPLDFSGVYRLLWEWWIKGGLVFVRLRTRKRWCLCNLLFLRSNTWFMCSRKGRLWFKCGRIFSLRGAYLQVSKQRGRVHMLCIRKHIFLMSFFF